MRHSVLGAACAATLFLAHPAGAQAPQPADSGGLSYGGHLDTEFNLESLGRRSGAGRHTELSNKTELGLYLNLPHGFAINTVLKFEPADRDPDGADRALRGQALWVDQLTLSWSGGPVQVFAGKIHPRFGFAWDRAPGLYGTDFAEGYELSEKIGAGVELAWSDLLGLTGRIGEHSVQVEFFAADRTVLSGSLGAARQATTVSWVDPDTGDTVTGTRYRRRNRLSHGGPDNTADYGNAVVSLAGSGVPIGEARLDYTLGFSSRQAGQDSIAAGTAATERGYVGGVLVEIPLPLRLTLTPIVEWLRQENADAVSGLRRDVVTAGFELARRPYGVSYVYQAQREAGAARSWAAAHGVTVSYDIGHAVRWLDGVTVNLGWRNLREASANTDDFGLQVTYGIRF